MLFIWHNLSDNGWYQKRMSKPKRIIDLNYTESIDLRVLFKACDFFNSDGVSPVIFLN
jgi:hypothetical protein